MDSPILKLAPFSSCPPCLFKEGKGTHFVDHACTDKCPGKVSEDKAERSSPKINLGGKANPFPPSGDYSFGNQNKNVNWNKMGKIRREARGHLLQLLLQLRVLEAGFKRGMLIQGFHSFGKCLLIAYPVHGVQGWSEGKEYRPTWTGMTQLDRCD